MPSFPNRRFSRRSQRRLARVHPELRRLLKAALPHLPYDIAITCGMRTRAEQAALVARGASRTMRSRHLRQLDGTAHAVDTMCIDPDTGRGTWEPHAYTANAIVLKHIAEQEGIPIRWGGDFRGFFDGPHFQLCKGASSHQRQARA
ncbi:MAG: M15 family metallopeptidase [Alphaproteobacteria bacterium]|nr:M15 family metallopeptidase [Alphaproteobacteria bacterium]